MRLLALLNLGQSCHNLGNLCFALRRHRLQRRDGHFTKLTRRSQLLAMSECRQCLIVSKLALASRAFLWKYLLLVLAVEWVAFRVVGGARAIESLRNNGTFRNCFRHVIEPR